MWRPEELVNQPGPQEDIILQTSTAETGAQCFLLGSDHLPGIGLGIENLIPSEINLNCANATTAGNLGVFFAKVRGEHYVTSEVVESRTMVYVIEGSIVLVSREVLETLGCIPTTFPRVGEFLKDGDAALTGKAFSVNPNPTGILSDGTVIDKPEENAAVKDTKKNGEVHPNNKQPDQILTSDYLSGEEYQASNQSSAILTPDYLSGEQYQARQMASRAGTRQPKGECDPESDLPCTCPRRAFVDPPDELPMPATDSNRKALEMWIKEYYKAGAFNTCKRQYWPVASHCRPSHENPLE